MAIELSIKGTLDEKTVDPVIEPYFSGFKKWWLTQKAGVIRSEIPLYSQRLGFCGTIDLVLGGDKIVDFKCSKSPDPVSELQGAAYQQLWGENFKEMLPFRVIQLPGDGTFKEIDYKTENPDLWDAVMALYHWRTKGKKAHPKTKIAEDE